jgi:hypothetical protein
MFLPWEGWCGAIELTRVIGRGGAGRAVVAPLVAAEGRKDGAALVVAALQGSTWQQQQLQRMRPSKLGRCQDPPSPGPIPLYEAPWPPAIAHGVRSRTATQNLTRGGR